MDDDARIEDAQTAPVNDGEEPVNDAVTDVAESAETVDPVEAVEVTDEPAEPAEAGDEPGADAAPADEPGLDEMVAQLREGDAQPSSEGSGEASELAEVTEPVTPEPVGTPASPADATTTLARDRAAAKAPFWTLVAAWIVFVAAMAYVLWPSASAPFVGASVYAYFVIGGVVLTLCGPLLGLTVWLVLRGSAGAEGAGLARAVFLRAGVATFSGVSLWWLALVALDLHRAGVLG